MDGGIDGRGLSVRAFLFRPVFFPARRWGEKKQNAAMFPVDDPTSPPLIGPSTIVVVNDARHQLQPEFLQRTTPYFFDVDSITQQYKWAKVRSVLLRFCSRSLSPAPQIRKVVFHHQNPVLRPSLVAPQVWCAGVMSGNRHRCCFPEQVLFCSLLFPIVTFLVETPAVTFCLLVRDQVAFVQTPQRFRKDLPDDPLGNHAASQVRGARFGATAVCNGGRDVAASGLRLFYSWRTRWFRHVVCHTPTAVVWAYRLGLFVQHVSLERTVAQYGRPDAPAGYTANSNSLIHPRFVFAQAKRAAGQKA